MVFHASLPLLFVEGLAVWLALHWTLLKLSSRFPFVEYAIKFLESINECVVVTGATLCALVVLTPFFTLTVGEISSYAWTQTREAKPKTLSDYVQWGSRVVVELSAMSERIRQAAADLNRAGDVELEIQTSNLKTPSAPNSILPERCGNVLLAVTRHSESLEQLFSALDGSEVEEMIYCECEDSEFRGEKIVYLASMLKECMHRQTDVVRAVAALCPLILPDSAASVSGDDADDSAIFL